MLARLPLAGTGQVTHRLVVSRGLATETDEATFSRSSAVKLGVTFTALTPINARPEPLAVWSMNTTTPALATTAEG
jgi:hypothetical protein